MALDLKIKDVSGSHELWFNAQGEDDHTQLDFGFTVTDEKNFQFDFQIEFEDWWILATAVNKKLGFDIFNVYRIEEMKKAYDQAWKEKKVVQDNALS